MKQAAIREQKKRALRGAAQPEPQSASAADMPSFPSEVFPDAPRRVPPGSPAPERLAAETRAPADRPFPIPRQGPRTPTEPGRSAAALRERPACPVPAIKTRQAAERTKLTRNSRCIKSRSRLRHRAKGGKPCESCRRSGKTGGEPDNPEPGAAVGGRPDQTGGQDHGQPGEKSGPGCRPHRLLPWSAPWRG